MIRHWAIASTLLALAACATVPAPVSNYRAERVDLARPEPGQLTQVAVGETVLASGHVSRSRGVTFAQAVALDQFTLHPGFYPMIGEDAAYSYHAFMTAPTGDGLGHIPPARDGMGSWLPAPDAVRIARQDQETCLIFVELGETACNRAAPYQRGTRDMLLAHDLNRKLIYRGANGERILLTYWEKSGHAARPESSRELSFVTGPDRLIEFAGARIRVDSADASSLRYTVLSGFSDFWGGTGN